MRASDDIIPIYIPAGCTDIHHHQVGDVVVTLLQKRSHRSIYR